jgi:flagellar biosynthesis protein FlhB
MAEDDSSKTEEPSGKKLGDAREKGQVIRSQDLGNFILLGGSTAVLLIMVFSISRGLNDLMLRFVSLPHAISVDPGNLQRVLMDSAIDLAMVLALPFLFFIIFAFLTGYLQFGLLLSTENLMPKLEKLNPIEGMKKIFSMRSVMELIKGILKMGIVGTVALYVLWPLMDHTDLFVTLSIGDLLSAMYEESRKLIIAVIVVIGLLAAMDYAYQRFEFMKKMRMTKQELKDEFKDMEGDPQIKAKLRQLRVEKSRKRMMGNVPTATVVVTNPTHYAVALKYEQNMGAPMVVAKGADLVAKKIRELAQKNFVPIVENPPLARALYSLVEIDQEVPEEHYRAVAEVIGYVMRMKKSAAA